MRILKVGEKKLDMKVIEAFFFGLPVLVYTAF